MEQKKRAFFSLVLYDQRRAFFSSCTTNCQLLYYFDYLEVIWFWGESLFQVLEKIFQGKTNCLHNSEDAQASSSSILAAYLQFTLL